MRYKGEKDLWIRKGNGGKKKVITYQSVKYVIVFLILWKRKPTSKELN